MEKIKRNLVALRRNQDGGVSVEFMLWVPVFTALMTGAVDVGTIFTHKSNYWSTARDTARQLARHSMTQAEAETYALQHATFGSVTPVVNISATPTEVTVRISGEADTISAFGIFGALDGANIAAEVTYALEPT